MPIYEYVCRKCSDEFEVLVRGGEQPECPACGSNSLQKQFSVPAAHAGKSMDLPMCDTPSSGGCGLPQCGQGRCGMES